MSSAGVARRSASPTKRVDSKDGKIITSAERSLWSDDLLLAVMDASPERICTVLDTHGEKAVACVMRRRSVGGNIVFVLDDQLYTRTGSLRDVLGGSFEFQREDVRDRIAQWLEMIGVANGDTLMHILMRVNGIDDMHKAKCAVEILGRGAPWENPNADGVIASEIDPAGFKLSWLRELPSWQSNQQRLHRERQLQEDRQRAEAHEQQKLQAERRAAAQSRQRWEEMRQQRRNEARAAKERLQFHRRLNQSLDKLEAREARLAKANPGVAESWANLRAVPMRIEHWLRDRKCPGFG